MTIIGYENAVTRADLAAGDAETALPIENIADGNGDPSSAWQTTAGVVTVGTGAWWSGTLTAGEPMRVASIHRTNLTTAATWRWRFYSGATVTVGDLVHDSGTIAAGVVRGRQQAVYVLPSEITARTWRCDINDTTNPDGFINIPLAYVGSGLVPGNGHSYRSTFRPEDVRETFETRGGQTIETPLFNRYSWLFELGVLRKEEAWASVIQIDRVARQRENILYIPGETAAEINAQAVFGLLQTESLGYSGQSGSVLSWRATIIERL